MEEAKKETPTRQIEVKPAEWSDKDQKLMEYALPVNRSGWAIACGYLGFFCIVPALNLLFIPLTIVTAVFGLRDLKKNPSKKGKGRIIFGIVMCVLGIPLFVLLIAAATRG